MDISGLANLTTGATTLSGLILVSPQKTIGYQPQRFPTYTKDTSGQDPAFLFHYEGEQSVTLEAEITDHVVENNEVVNDQIALRPEIITTRGFIGELNNVPPKELKEAKIVANKLVSIGAYAPALSVTALTAYNQAAFLHAVAMQAANNGVAAWDYASGKNGLSVLNGEGSSMQKNQTEQQKAFQKFYGYFRSRTLFTVQTPWAVFQDCAIMRVNTVQDEETNMITSFEITFKVIRFAKTMSEAAVSVSPETSQGRASKHSAREADMGPQNASQTSKIFDPSKLVG